MPIPERFPMVFSDRVNAASSVVYVPEIHWVLDFDGPVDVSRLKRALRLVLDAEPVLGCRLVPRAFSPYWERLDKESLDRAGLVRCFEGGEAAQEEAAQDFFGELLDGETGPQLKALLLPRPGGDRLILKVNHCTCDAGGFKELLYTLADTYRCLDQNPDFVPEPRPGSRSLRQVYGRFSLLQLLAIFWQGLVATWRMVWPFRSMQYPSGKKEEGRLRYVFARFPGPRVEGLHAYARSRGATINDVFVTAMLRAMARQTKWNGKTALRLAGTVDLRRYLPGRLAQALCQITGMYSVSLGKRLEDDFDGTLARVKAWVDAQKARYFGLGLFFMLWVSYLPYPYFLFKRAMGSFWRTGIADGNLPPGFTNLGPVDPKACDFTGPRTTGAFMAIPATRPPWFGAGLSSFGTAVTLSAGVWPSAVPLEKVEELFSLVDKELPGA